MARDRRLGGSTAARVFADREEDMARAATAKRERLGIGQGTPRPRINQGRGIGTVVGPSSGSRGRATPTARVAPFSAPQVMGGFSNPNLFSPPVPEAPLTPQGGPQPSRGARGAGGSSAVALPPTVAQGTAPAGPTLPPVPAPIPELEEARSRVSDIQGIQFGSNPTAPGFDVNSPLAASGSVRFSDEPEENAISFARMRTPEEGIARGIIAPPTVTPEPDKFVRGQRFSDVAMQRKYDLAQDALSLEMQKEEPDQARLARIQSEIDRMLAEAGLDLSAPPVALGAPGGDEVFGFNVPFTDTRISVGGRPDQPPQAPQQQGQPQSAGTPPPAPQGQAAAQTSGASAIASAPPEIQQEIARRERAGQTILQDDETGEFFYMDQTGNPIPIGAKTELPTAVPNPVTEAPSEPSRVTQIAERLLDDNEPELQFQPGPTPRLFQGLDFAPRRGLSEQQSERLQRRIRGGRNQRQVNEELRRIRRNAGL